MATIIEGWFCDDTTTAEELAAEIAFCAQAPELRDFDEEPLPYTPVRTNDEITTGRTVTAAQTMGECLYDEWSKTGKLATRRTEGYNYQLQGEQDTLLNAYCEVWGRRSTDPEANNFCDALVDGMAEFLDERGLDMFSWKTLWTLSSTEGCAPMFELVAFYSILTPPAYASNISGVHPNANFDLVCEVQRRKYLSDGKTTKEAWDEFMMRHRCRYHTHTNGECWRQRDTKISAKI